MDTQTMITRIDDLERRVAALEAATSAATAPVRARRAAADAGGGGGIGHLDTSRWTRTYEPVELDVSGTWIELHEQSARPQLQRLIREVVEHESPVTDRLVLDRVRRAWGLRRAGGRVQEAFEQSVRQLVARGLVERAGDTLRRPGHDVEAVRVPGDDESTRRSADEVPIEELSFGIEHVVRANGGSANADDATMQVAKLLGWTRRGGAIQERLDAALAHGSAAGAFELVEGCVRTGP